MVLVGVVESAGRRGGCGFVTVAVSLSVDGDVKTTCAARVAVPAVPTTLGPPRRPVAARGRAS